MHEVENIHQCVFTKKCSMIYTSSTKLKLLREKLETVNKSISKEIETFVMFLYLRNGKYVNNFIYCFYFMGIIVTITYSSLTVFFTNYKVSKQDTLFARYLKCCLKVEKSNKNILLCYKADVTGMDIIFIKWNIDFGFRKLTEICEAL